MFDIRSILNFPSAYRLLQNLTRTKRHTKQYADRYIRAKSGDKVLDIGCGPADILEFLPQVEYCGFDANPKYIKEAKKRYHGRGTFFCGKLSHASQPAGMSFDIVLANKVLHHLNDREAVELFKLAAKCLKPGGRLITCDGCRTKENGFILRVMANMDRGKYMRYPEGYVNLARQVFSKVEYDFRNDFSTIPIKGNGVFIVCTKI